MKRVYTDDRFPGVEVVNYGGTQFFGFKDGQQVDEFSAYESPAERVSESFAQRRADAYFQRLVEQVEMPLASEIEQELKQPDGVSESDPVPVQIVGYLLAD